MIRIRLGFIVLFQKCGGSFATRALASMTCGYYLCRLTPLGLKFSYSFTGKLIATGPESEVFKRAASLDGR